jgi:replicative DNA helicase
MTLVNLNQYGMPFQIKVLSSLLTHKEFLLNIHDILSDEYFDNQAHKWIIKEVMKYYEKYHTTPSMDVLKVELQRVTNDVLKVSIKEQLKSAYEASEEDLEYVQEEFASFCKNQQLKKALLTSVDFLNAGDYDSIRSMINNAIKAGEDRNIGHEYEKDIESRYREDARNVIPFPWSSFNNITQGGYGSGDLVLIFGNPKGGKSWATIAMAAEAVKLGFNIVYYALELGENYVGKRFDACLTGIPVDEVVNSRNKVEEIASQLPGRLVIKEYPPKRATLSTIESHLEKLDFKPDAIFIDYLDLLSNRKTRSERKDDIDDVYTDAKGLAKELKIPIISPSQANRSGAEKAILESSHIAGSFDKIMIGDIVISLSRGRKDRLEGTGRWHFMGNRYGKDGCTFFSPKIDTSTGHFEIDESEMDEEDIDTAQKTNKKDIEVSEKKFLKEKFFELGMG